jgi:hypothetical protein
LTLTSAASFSAAAVKVLPIDEAIECNLFGEPMIDAGKTGESKA